MAYPKGLLGVYAGGDYCFILRSSVNSWPNKLGRAVSEFVYDILIEPGRREFFKRAVLQMTVDRMRAHIPETMLKDAQAAGLIQSGIEAITWDQAFDAVHNACDWLRFIFSSSPSWIGYDDTFCFSSDAQFGYFLDLDNLRLECWRGLRAVVPETPLFQRDHPFGQETQPMARAFALDFGVILHARGDHDRVVEIMEGHYRAFDKNLRTGTVRPFDPLLLIGPSLEEAMGIVYPGGDMTRPLGRFKVKSGLFR